MPLEASAQSAADNHLFPPPPLSPATGRMLAASLGAIGLYVLTGWTIGSESMVRVFPHSVAMSVNTAILAVAAAICLGSTQGGTGWTWLRTAAASLLVALPLAILFEHWTDHDLGIDWVALNSTVKDGNPRPGRTAPNACIALLMTGVFYLLVDHRATRNSRTLQAVVAVMVYGTLAIAVSGLAGHILKLDALYSLGSFNRMAAPTAISIVLAGVAMKLRLDRMPWQEDTGAGNAMRRIVKGSAATLTVVALVTGLTGFSVLKGSFDDARFEASKSTTDYTTAVIADLLDQHFRGAKAVAESDALRKSLGSLNAGLIGTPRWQTLHAIGDSLLALAFGRVTLLDVDGNEVASFGRPIDPGASLAVAIDRGATHGMLSWDDGFVLRTEEAVIDQGRVVGRLIAWQRMPAMTAVVLNLRAGNESTDVLICAKEGTYATCFPSRFYPRLHIPLEVDGRPNLAISRALLGERGVMAVDDARGKNVVAGYAPIGDYGLGLVVKTDSGDLYAPMRERLNLLAGLLVLIIGGGTLVLRAYLKPLAHRLVERHLALQESEERLGVTLRSIGDAVITTDVKGTVSYLNPVAETLTGWSTAEACGLPLAYVFRIVYADSSEVAPSPLVKVMQTKTAGALVKGTELVQRGGARFHIEDSAAPIIDANGGILGAVIVFHDVSHAHAMAAEMTHQATHDPLTGLINRREFERRLMSSLQTSEAEGNEHSVLYLDLDQFKIINDRCGHGAGDELLRQLTSLLHDKLRRGDTLSRLGGDEFGVLLESCGAAPAWKVADVLRQTVADFRFSWDDKTFAIGVSIGLVTFGDDGLSLVDVLRMADSACYVAKDKGRNRIHVYTVDDEELAQRSGQMGWIGRIHKALEEQRFELFSQRILAVGAATEEGHHYELLLRLRDEDGAIVAPMAFIPAAERYGLMPLLDRWVITTAFTHFATLHGGDKGMCAINLSANSICDETFAAFIQEAFATHRVPPRCICFEITETAAVTNLKQATIFIRSLKAIGCRFALDDFGSGMSSFAHLKHLPVDFLKIDGAFVKDMADDPIDRAMVRSIHEIGHVMGLKTIAEFVENDAILAELKAIGVDYAQGYGIEKPRPAW